MVHIAVRGAGAHPSVCYVLNGGRYALTQNGQTYDTLDACVSAGALLGAAHAAQVMSTEQSRFARQLSDSIDDNSVDAAWFWPLVGAVAVAGLLLALRDQRRRRTAAYA